MRFYLTIHLPSAFSRGLYRTPSNYFHKSVPSDDEHCRSVSQEMPYVTDSVTYISHLGCFQSCVSGNLCLMFGPGFI